MIVVLLLLVVLILAWPINIKNMSSKPNQVGSYIAAMQQIQALQARDTQDINPVCRSEFMTHDKKVEQAIVFLHGFTNCPQQFHELGLIFYNRGYNVLIPRMPHHGLVDRMTSDQAQLTAEELVALGNEVVDIAHGLGDHVIIVGFSAGGTLTGWIAQYRSDIELAVIISPVFGLEVIPVFLTKPTTNLVLTIPNFFLWWDSELKANIPGPKHAYPRFSSRALGEILRLGLAVQTTAYQSKPATQSILVVTNANDSSVNAEAIAEVVSNWQKNDTKNLQTYEFEVNLQLQHDLIDSAQVDQRVDMVYPILVNLITRR